MSFNDRISVLFQLGEAPLGIAAKKIDQIHDVAAEHPQVLPAAAGVFLAAAAQLQEFAQFPAS